MWRNLFGGLTIGAIVSCLFLWSRFIKFGFIKKISKGKLWLRLILGLIPIVFMVIAVLIDRMNTGIVIIHMCIVWILAEIIGAIVQKIIGGRNKKKNAELAADDSKGQDGGTADTDALKRSGKPYVIGIIVLCFEFCYFVSGWFLAHHMFETDYHITTTKDIGADRIRVAVISDVHLGAVFDGNGFKERIETIQAAEPDVLLIVGDFVDNDTDKKDLQLAYEALAELNCPYGKYFVYGNHDKGQHWDKGFTAESMHVELGKAGVRILQDKALLVDDRFYIIGRQDRSSGGRKSMSELMEGLDQDKYMIVMDHQPTDFAAESEAGPDLVVSGHTHGGQMLEIKLVMSLMKANDRIYGLEKRNNTNFIVSSGMGNWSIAFKTGTKSEFCVIDITN